jgi:hypothetical protein
MPRTIRLRFDTDTTRRMQEVQQFYLDNDGFYAEQKTREGSGFPIGTYHLPTRGKIDVRLLESDLDRHALVLGSTGTGKSSMLELIARMAFQAGRGCALIDPHGDLFERVAAWALHAKVSDLTILDFTRPDLLPGWNPLKPLPGVDPGRQVDLLIGIFKRLYADEDARSFALGVKVQEILRFSFRAAIESEVPCTLDTLRSFLLIPALRSRLLATASADVRYYFHERFTKREESFVPAVLNKLEPFLGSMAVQRFLGQPTNTIDPLAIMDRGGTLLVNLAKGYLGPTADILGLAPDERARARRAPARAPANRAAHAVHPPRGRGAHLRGIGRRARRAPHRGAQIPSLARPRRASARTVSHEVPDDCPRQRGSSVPVPPPAEGSTAARARSLRGARQRSSTAPPRVR